MVRLRRKAERRIADAASCLAHAGACIAVPLAVATLVCAATPAVAQDSEPTVRARIETVFKLVPHNLLELARPLSRRALARRLAERGAVPLAYADASASDLEEVFSHSVRGNDATVSNRDVVALPSTGDMAEAQGDADEAPARLPRSRPGDAREATVVSAAAAATATATANATTGVAATQPGPGVRVPRGRPADVLIAAPRPPPQEALPVDSDAEVQVAALASAPAPVELVAQKHCLPLGKVKDRDGDFKRNADVLSAPSMCIAEESFKERRRPWTIQIVESGRPGPLWAVMHDDEDLAFDNAVKALKANGGTLVAVETGGKRNQDGIDPNRNFSDSGIGCAKLGKNAAPHFTGIFATLLQPARPVVAMHNNVDAKVPTGGVGHVAMSTVPKDMTASPADDSDGPLAGDGALVLLATVEPVAASVTNRMDALSANGLNVVLEKIRSGHGDCSLSNYVALSGNPDYFNVTVDHDEGARQQAMVRALLASAMPSVSASR